MGLDQHNPKPFVLFSQAKYLISALFKTFFVLVCSAAVPNSLMIKIHIETSLQWITLHKMQLDVLPGDSYDG